jgi:hypothetical protein
VCNLVESYCNDWDHLDIFCIDKIPIIMIFVNVPLTSGSRVTLTQFLPMLGHSPRISLCPTVSVIIDSLVKCHAFNRDEGGMRGGRGDGVWPFVLILLLVCLAVLLSCLELWLKRDSF